MNLEIIPGFETADQLAKQAGSDLAERVLSLLESKTVHVVLAGGSVGIKTLAELAPHLLSEDLSKLHLWWGDERFLEEISDQRNYRQAEHALLEKISIPAENLHQMPSTENGPLAEAASIFANQIEKLKPEFDIVLLGMGPDGHVASLFPESSPTNYGDWVVAEAHSPKPPAERISLSLKALSSAREVWFLVSGPDKANAVKNVFLQKTLPAALVSGKETTRWYLDLAAAAELTS
jgi:6-phosphogluconolactonase